MISIKLRMIKPVKTITSVEDDGVRGKWQQIKHEGDK